MNEASKTAIRQRVLFGIALAILGIYAVFSVLDARSAAQRLALAHQDLSEVKQKLNEIKMLSAAPSIAALETEPPGAITLRIDSALEQAGLPVSTKLSQDPPIAQRITGTQYESQNTVINLAPTTLPKIVAFCEALRDAETGSVVSDLNLTIPRNSSGGGGPETWKATLTLTQTIYSPKSQ
tara:strand:+ start:1016441 stop:1016983 length:543 start_codon:yes stop_codon:yes gene_type:complete